MANFIVSKDTLVAYTIAVIQQTLDYHFGQMSIVYQSAHNSATHDTPLRAEELVSEHFNIALLTDQTPGCLSSNDTNNMPPPTVDPTPTTSTRRPHQNQSTRVTITQTRNHSLQVLYPLLADLNRDFAMGYQRAMRLMIAGVAILLMLTRRNRHRT